MKIFLIFLLLCQIVWGETAPSATINIVQKPYESYMNKLENKELGFVLFDRNITVGKSIEKYSIGVMVNVEPNLEVYSIAMSKLFQDIQGLLKVLALQGKSKETAPLKLLMDSIKLKQTMIEHQFKQIAGFSNVKNDQIINELNICKLDVPVIAAKEVEVIIDDLISSVNDMDRLTNDADIKNGTEGKQTYLGWVYALYHYEKTLEGLWDKANTLLTMLENLNSHLIPERLPLMLVGTTCSNVNGKQSLDILECEKSPKGLYCQLSARAQVKTEMMHRYVPINYNGIKLAFPIEDAFLVRVNDKSWAFTMSTHGIHDH